jgi:exo-1,4-beta-D-glucosaminidase
VIVSLANRSKAPAFFLRAEVVKGAEGDEILPITWDDNYITLFAGESKTLTAHYKMADADSSRPVMRLQGHNISTKVEAIKFK